MAASVTPISLRRCSATRRASSRPSTRRNAGMSLDAIPSGRPLHALAAPASAPAPVATAPSVTVPEATVPEPGAGRRGAPATPSCPPSRPGCNAAMLRRCHCMVSFASGRRWGRTDHNTQASDRRKPAGIMIRKPTRNLCTHSQPSGADRLRLPRNKGTLRGVHSHAQPTHSAVPSAKTCRFQMGTCRLMSSTARRHREKASPRCGLLTATIIATSPTASSPVRCRAASRHPGSRVATRSATSREPGRGAGMRLVVEPDDGPAPVGVPDRPDKHCLAPGGRGTDGIEALVHGQ